MDELCNLVVDLDERFASVAATDAAVPLGIVISEPQVADETLLAWIDEEFGGSWSSEVYAGACVVARHGDRPIGFAAFDATGLRFRWLQGLAREREVGLFGPFGVLASQRGKGVGRALLVAALRALRARGYLRALIAAVGEESLVRYYAHAAGARVAERFARAALVAPRPRVVMLASGNGTNVASVLDNVQSGTLGVDPISVVTNVENAGVIARAQSAGVGVCVLPWNRRDESRASYDARLLEAVAALQPDIVLLLGWMHLLDADFVHAFGNVLNVHPAFLPLDPQRDDVGLPDGTRMRAFRGRAAVRDALAAGSRWAGATVHAVTADTDRGPVLARKPLRVAEAEEVFEVMQRLHPIEHELVRGAIMRTLYERK